MKSSNAIPIAIVAAGIMLAFAVYITTPKPAKSTPPVGNPSLVRPVTASDHILGNPAAQVTIVEYSDFDCAYCRGFNTILHKIIAKEGASGKVAWVFREFPLTEIHTNALSAAEAAECAAKAGGNAIFWKFADALFAHQPLDPTQYGAIAQSVGVPSAAFASCYSNAKTTVDPRIQADRKNALAMGAPGAPYSVILVRGKAPVVMYGAYSYDATKQLIDAALTQAQ